MFACFLLSNYNNINGSLNILKRGIGFSFKVENEIFRPTKIDIQKKLLNFACQNKE